MMASATNAAAPTNAPSGTTLGSAATQKDASSRQSNKSAGNAKMTDRGRKESPVDQGRRAPAQKAWTSGTNPLTQRGSTPTQPNGNANHTKAATNSKMAGNKEGGLSDKHSHDRLRFILGGAIGLSVLLSTKSGERFEGIFAGTSLSTHNSKITLKMTRKITSNSNSQANGMLFQEAALIGTSPDYAMAFDMEDMADVSIPQFCLPETAKQTNGATSSFQTDTDISASTARGNDRVLQKWVPDGPDTTDFSLESGGIGQWDQFAAHKQRFGDNSTYDENMYTTTIDRSAPGYKQREAHANKKAQEILGQTSAIAHVREERGLDVENDFEDEEDKYSGVRRDNGTFSPLPVGGSNKYIPPAQRAPSSHTTVSGAPVDSAIISAQLSKPNNIKPAAASKTATPSDETQAVVVPDQPRQAAVIANGASDSPVEKGPEILAPGPPLDVESKSQDVSTAKSLQRAVDNPTDDVEVKVLDHFRLFAKSEKERFAERKRAQANQDRTAKINDLLRFHKNFKLKTPIPTDLVGILAKDPAKQEAIIERAQKEHEESKSGAVTTSAATSTTPVQATPARDPPLSKFDASQIPGPIPDRATLNRGRGGHQQHAGRGDRAALQQGQFSGRGGAQFPPRAGGPSQDRKNQVPPPIALIDGRMPPTGPVAEQPQSPQRSNMHTPSSAVSSRFNVKAMEFRPNVNAPAFNPTAPSIAPSSPSSVQRADSPSRAASPPSFFGARKPKSDKLPVSARFNSIKRMQEEIQKKKTKPKSSDKPEEPIKDYPYNGGIPNAYHTGPVWQVKADNQEKSYAAFFGRSGSVVSPTQTRSSTSTQHVPYQGQLPAAMNGVTSVPQISTSQHGALGGAHTYTPHFEEQRMHMHAATPQVYPSPGMSSRQMSNFSSPMSHQAQLAYGQSQYYGGPAQMNMQMRPFPATPGMMHAQPGQIAAPMMVQQQSNGPYMAAPQHYNQIPMYSPGTAHVYPQQNGYPSPGRMAPMMMHQGSQQGHHNAQQMMYAVPGQAGPMMYQQQGQMSMMRGGYGGGHYGSSPQAHHMQQRATSSGYGKGIPQVMSQSQGPPPNAPQQPAAFGQVDLGTEDVK